MRSICVISLLASVIGFAFSSATAAYSSVYADDPSGGVQVTSSTDYSFTAYNTTTGGCDVSGSKTYAVVSTSNTVDASGKLTDATAQSTPMYLVDPTQSQTKCQALITVGPVGTYYWQVQATGCQGGTGATLECWSSVAKFTSITPPTITTSSGSTLAYTGSSSKGTPLTTQSGFGSVFGNTLASAEARSKLWKTTCAPLFDQIKALRKHQRTKQVKSKLHKLRKKYKKKCWEFITVKQSKTEKRGHKRNLQVNKKA